MESRPRILHLSSSAAPLGGVWTYIQLLCRSELGKKYEIEVRHFPGRHRGISWASIQAIRGTILEVRPQLVHLHGLLTEGFHLAMGARLAGGVPSVMTVHGFIEDSQFRVPWRRWLISRVLEPFSLRLVDHFYCVSRFGTQKRVIRRRGHGNRGVIDNGIPVQPVPARDLELRGRLGFREQDVVGICVCRLSWEKGLGVLADALPELECDPALRFLVVGDGPQRGEIEARFKNWIERGRVVFTGARSDVDNLLGAADYFVLPTLHEHQSFAILEAMRAGKAIVTTSAGGNPELVEHGRNGWLVEPGNPAALAEAILRVGGDERVRQQMGEASRERAVSQFSLDRLAADVARLYEEVRLRQPS